ncbi:MULTISPECIES: DUF1648 domain-containing protein [unclassified Streptomyces]|uniref:DUF1648 domain-containing protein n=1 Tax=unclassified Streptomyces TaxID=2593676 RepID=UPI002DD97FF3|nr:MULTISPECIES: DUF1648 domain-containing protein [unclassified Streptomyces]WSA95631.1 DUF1648 domain-containing protein [Streptomyces sp. NBC_01795]WSB80049.1 DUF1648 domain-containing protein [Streptomyces sp. NBC_01775]WSS11743.1 DUF1648 domain-containing protein [Streptomyces sp. NBC_01186]WSS40456.1 DUF1648 domain-containing protein [Streptomyces sp. NBC_01187]
MGAQGHEEGRAGFPWLWLAPGILVLAGLTVWGIMVYPQLPGRVPQHLGSDGVDSYAAKSVGSVFVPVFLHAGVLAVMSATALLTLRVRPESELAPGERVSSLVNRPRTRRGARRAAKAQLFLACCVGMGLAVACTLMWRTDPLGEQGENVTLPLLLTMLPLLAGTLAVLATAVLDRRGRGRDRDGQGARTGRPAGRKRTG